ncbi:retrovirus-related pol polyprotein from transposon TNT 1-94 [Tanacetum coccineum]
MSNTNNNLQTQTSNALHNAIIEAGGKDRPPMLAPGNYNQPYKFKWTEKTVPATEGSSDTTTEGYMENYKNVSQDIRNQLDVEAEAVQIILTGIDNDIYSIVDACLNACEMWKAIERGKEIVNSPSPTYDQEPDMVTKDDEMSKEKEIDKLMALISLSFKKIYKPTNNNLKTSSNTSRANQDNYPITNRGTGDGTDDKPKDQELEAHSLYMAHIQEVTLDAANNSGSIFDAEPLQKVQNDDDNYNVFTNDKEHPKQPEYVNVTYLKEHERDLLASLIDKLKCEIDDNKNRNKLLESSNKTLVDKLQGEIEDFKNKSLESSNNHFKEANNKLSKTNQLMFKDLKRFQAALNRYHDVNYASKVEIDCAKAKGDLMSYKIESQKSFNEYTRKINDLNQTISEMKKELFAHQETISIMSQEKEAQKKFYKTREDKEIEKVIALENKVKFLKKAQRANPRLYDIGCYNDNLALMLAPNSDETIRVIPTTSVSRPQLKSNQLEDRVMHNNSQGKKQQVEDHRRNFKFSNNKTSVTACNDSLNAKTSNVNFVCVTCGKCVLNDNHDMCVLHYINGVNSRTKQPIVVPISTREPKRNLLEIILFIVDSGCSKHMTGNLKLLCNFVEKFLGTVKFGNDQIASIIGYGDMVQGNVTIKRVYYVEGLNHNLLSVGQFCDANLEVAFRKSTCYIRDLKGNDLLTGSRGTNLYSITLQDTSTPNPICLMAKTSSSQAWLWHRRLSHLNFDTINLLSKYDIVTGLPKLKFIKDHLCSSCELGKAKCKSLKTKTTPSLKRRLQIPHMDLCGPMRIENFNGKKYVLCCARLISLMLLRASSLLNAVIALDNAVHNVDLCVPKRSLLILFEMEGEDEMKRGKLDRKYVCSPFEFQSKGGEQSEVLFREDLCEEEFRLEEGFEDEKYEGDDV